MVDGIQPIYDDGWDPGAQSDDSKSEQVTQCMNLEHCLHRLHLEPIRTLSCVIVVACCEHLH
jgi:hypothetical protein